MGLAMAGEAIFVGYRRDDTADVAGRIYDAMAQRFGKQRVFRMSITSARASISAITSRRFSRAAAWRLF